MEPRAIAEILLVIVDAQKLTDAQRYEVIGRFTSGMMSGLRDVDALVPPQRPGPAARPAEVHTEQELPPGNVMIPAGTQCECDTCNKIAYNIIDDIYENTKKKDFVDAFQPANGAPELKMPLDTWADEYGNIAIDCPLCKGAKTLWIKGKGPLPYRDTVGGNV